MGKFDQTFAEVQHFTPEGSFLSSRVYDREEALTLFREDQLAYSGETVLEREDLGEAWVRFVPTPECMKDELGKMAWMVCSEMDKRSQPCWTV